MFSFPSDSAVKQILVTLDERPGQSFIIEDLDEFHVLIRADEEQRVKRELEAEVCVYLHPAISPLFLMEVRAAREEYVQHGSLDGRQNVVVDAMIDSEYMARQARGVRRYCPR